jgi:hypothetical protein
MGCSFTRVLRPYTTDRRVEGRVSFGISIDNRLAIRGWAGDITMDLTQHNQIMIHKDLNFGGDIIGNEHAFKRRSGLLESW